MEAEKKLAQLSTIDGFVGAALFTPEGEMLLKYEMQESHLEIVGVLANSVLMNAQKASLEMGYGRGQFVHVQADNALILIRCLNEGKSPLRSEPGKSHIHLVLVVDDHSSLGMAKMEINKVIDTLAADFRLPEAETNPSVPEKTKKAVAQSVAKPAARPAAKPVAKPAAKPAQPQAKKKQVKRPVRKDLQGVVNTLSSDEIDDILDSMLD